MTEPRVQTIATVDVEIVDGNPNRMDPDEFERLVGAIDKVGFLQPILVRPSSDPESVPFVLVDGEHRLRAFMRLGGTDIPAVVVDAEEDLGEALRIGMNRLRGEMSLTSVGTTLDGLMRDGWSLDDLELTGFGSDEIERLIEAVREDPLEELLDAAPPPAPIEKPKRFALSISFETEADRARAKAALLDAAGDDGTIADGLLELIS